MSEAARHHYVPRFLLRQWARPDARGQMRISGYYWDSRAKVIKCFPGGENSFCYRRDLFTIGPHRLGRDAIERVFFKGIDDAGALVHRHLIDRGAGGLTAERRSDFVQLLLSLDARRPANVDNLVARAERFFREGLDGDEKIRLEMDRQGYKQPASALYEQWSGHFLADHAMMLVQSLTTNKAVGQKLVNFTWGVYRLGAADGHFVFGDRPLIRINPIDDPGAVWAMPLSPKVAFIAAASERTVASIKKATPKRFRILLNNDSAMQCDRFVFSVDLRDEQWLAKRLRRQNPTGPEIVGLDERSAAR